MATKKQEEPVKTPFTDPVFARRTVSFGSLEFQRMFEQNLIRYGALMSIQPTKAAADSYTSTSETEAQSVSQPAATQPETPYDEPSTDPNEYYGGDERWHKVAGADSNIVKVGSAVSGTARNTNETERTNSEDVYTLIKQVSLSESINAVRIKFTLATSSALRPAYGRIYRNGAAIGTERVTDEELGEEFSEDFTGLDWEAGDLIQIYAYIQSGIGHVTVSDMQFCYDRAIIGLGGWTLVTGIPIIEQDAYVINNIL